MGFEADTPLSEDARWLLTRLTHRAAPAGDVAEEPVLGRCGACIPVWDDDPE